MLYAASALLLTAAASLKWKKRPERVLPPLLCLGAVALFGLGLLRALAWADALAWLALAAVLWLGLGWMRQTPRERRARALAALCTPGLVCFLLLAVGLWWGCRERLVWFADEFNYWATEVKSLWYFGGFVGSDLCLTPSFASYPPGMPLLQWAAMRAFGGWSDGTLYFAQFLACCTLLLPLTERLTWRRWYGVPVFCVAALAVPTLYNAFAYAYLGVDVALGCAYAYALIELRRPDYGGRFSRLCLGAALCLLALLKASGLVFVALTLLGAWLLRCPRPRLARERLRAAACWLAPLLLAGVWALFCQANGLSSKHGEYVAAETVAGAAGAAGGTGALNAGAVALEMLRALLRRTAHAAGGATYQPLLLAPFLAWGALLCALPWALGARREPCGQRASGRRVSVYALCAFVGYLVVLWVGFLTVFGGETVGFTAENDNLMGRLLERYLCPVLLGLTGLCAWEAALVPRGVARRLTALACAALLLLCGNWRGLSVYVGGSRYAAAFAEQEDVTATMRARLPFTATLPYDQPLLVMVDDRWLLDTLQKTQYGAAPVRLTYFYVGEDYPLEELLAHFRLHGVTHVACMSREEPFYALMRQLLPGEEVRLGVVYALTYHMEDTGVTLTALSAM